MSDSPSSEFPVPLVDFTSPEYFQEELSVQEKALRDVYILELLKDFNWRDAAIRTGFHIAFVDNWVECARADAYIQQRLSHLKISTEVKEDDQLSRDKQLILNTLREASQQGPYNTRVAAAGKLAQIQGLDKSEDESGKREEELIGVLKDFAAKVK